MAMMSAVILALILFVISLLLMFFCERIRRVNSLQGYDIDCSIVYANLLAAAVWTVILWIPSYALWLF